jgi:hypothetical protein
VIAGTVSEYNRIFLGSSLVQHDGDDGAA